VAGFGLLTGGYMLVNHGMFNVEGGHRAILYSRLGGEQHPARFQVPPRAPTLSTDGNHCSGIQDNVLGEGTHFKIPWLHRPYIFNVRSTPRNIKSLTGSRGETRERDPPCMPYHEKKPHLFPFWGASTTRTSAQTT
jgi:prohibitin 2